MKIIFTLTFLFSLNLQAWTLNSSTGKGFKSNEIDIYIANTSCSGAGMTLDQYEGLIKSAVKHYWNSVPTSALYLNVKGLRTDIDIAGDDHDAALLKVPVNTILAGCNTSADQFTDGRILGSAKATCSGSDCQAVLILNANAASNLPTYSDAELEAVIAHEIGHAFGLGHSEYKESLMYFSVSGKFQKWLGEDDIDGVTYLYPNESELDILGVSLLGNCGAIADDGSGNYSNKDWLISLFFGIFIIILFRKLLLFIRK